VAEEFEGELAGAVFWGADLTGARFRDVDLTHARISHALLVDVDIDATIEQLVVNGVDVTDFVNERDPWYPLRSMLMPTDPADMRATWAALQAEWAATLALAESLPEPSLHESVGGEWSFVQTLRHVVFAIDKWFTVPILGGSFDPIGLPNSGSADFPWPDLDQRLTPTFTEARDAHLDRVRRFGESLDSLDPSEYGRNVDVLENGDEPYLHCVHAVFDEAFWHNRYARRDLERLASVPTGGDVSR
jgi:hypothetical protein